ncbi:MAG: endonuclease/exonuclease/phosphatase family protein [Acholeplasmatales bacterium]|nr:MAG: endonuclease/exonuclease/phosphatase family protein [Acholeplasmatales bacterium]
MTTSHNTFHLLISKRLLMLLGLVFVSVMVVACDSDQDDADDRDHTILNIMSYNMRFEMEDRPDDVHTWARRKPGIVDSFARYDADVVGTQELRLWQLEELMTALGDTWADVGESRFLNTDEHVSILYRADRYELLEGDTLWLSETPEVRGSKSWDSAHPRIVTYVKLRSLAEGFEFYVFNTHLDHRSSEARRNGLNLIVDLMLDVGDVPVIFTGDLNMFLEAEDMRGITDLDHRFMDTFTPFSPAFDVHGRTSHGFNGGTEGRAIDFIFYSVAHFDVLETQIIHDRWQDRWWLSDHYPVFSRLKIEES